MPKGAKECRRNRKKHSGKAKGNVSEDSGAGTGEKIKKLTVFLAKERQEKTGGRSAALEKLIKRTVHHWTRKRFLAICEKYWPDATTKKPKP